MYDPALHSITVVWGVNGCYVMRMYDPALHRITGVCGVNGCYVMRDV